nr:histidine kinase [Spirochaeta sp.]
LQAQATVAELRALRAQINPHFFFNTLNTISHLIETDTDTAGETVQHMADLFRYTLAAAKFDQVPFGDELRHVQTYLRIEQLRHGDALLITYEIDNRLHDHPVPPMLIQPLVENAVRYGGNEFGIVDLTIAGGFDHSDLVVEIRDRGSEVVDPESLFHADGTGIKNVNHRFRTLFGRPITVRRNEPSGLIVTLTIPGGAV